MYHCYIGVSRPRAFTNGTNSITLVKSRRIVSFLCRVPALSVCCSPLSAWRSRRLPLKRSIPGFIPRCTGARSGRLAPDARALSPAFPASPTSSISASITAASGAPPTTVPPGCRCSTTSPPAPSAPSPWRRPIPTSSTSARGAGIIRPDLSVGDGMYKSTDAGKTWTHLGLRDSQMIAMIDVDPQQSRPPVRGRPGPSLRSQSGARHFPLHRWRRALREGAL